MNEHPSRNWTETSAPMNRREIEDARLLLKVFFPNKSAERHTFNKICDQAVRSLKEETPVSETAPLQDPEILNAARRYQFLKQHHLGTLLSLFNTTDTSDVGLDYAVDRDIERCQW